VALLSFAATIVCATDQIHAVGRVINNLSWDLPYVFTDYGFRQAISVPFGVLTFTLVLTALSLTFYPKLAGVSLRTLKKCPPPFFFPAATEADFNN
jgi:hypothetical protein